ncbi:GNAT family N-acetyltransferase [Bailinhaonella thermotolerans]|uniref:GNAT family N-acetyltransferase n=1 Tax=Bailinhaonella thermotolerans TaxID=1070861 RepID=A0A3A4B4P3_9ACTN|nr:GNAT family N-acetyltransferase [Bailinhaonella thermotolerans]RJL35550.1 GNAT family N-acetyltransferase [Bailinhaonella thermotolerans]
MTPGSQPAPLIVRAARADDPGEIDRLYEICLRTAAHGGDASGMLTEHRLLGDIFVGPYLAHSPDLAWVVAPDEALGVPSRPVGYFLAVADTASFEDELERRWWPRVRAREPRKPAEPGSPDALLRSYLADPPRTPAEIAARYPAHIHVDLLPEAQGGGHGRRLWTTAIDALRERGVPGVHLGVAAANTKAQGFYRHLGLHLITETPTTKYFGMPLPPPT